MAKYRDEVEAARLRAETLEAKLAEKEAELAERDAAIVAREAELNELRAKLEREPQAAKPVNTKTSQSATLALVGIAFIAIAGGAVAYLASRPPDNAMIEIHVTEAGTPLRIVNIFVGKEKVCQFSPCTTHVHPGEMYIRAATQDGRRDEVLLVAESGESAQITIDLPAPPEPPARPKPASAPPKKTAKDCGCKPEDLMCNMRCTAK